MSELNTFARSCSMEEGLLNCTTSPRYGSTMSRHNEHSSQMDSAGDQTSVEVDESVYAEKLQEARQYKAAGNEKYKAGEYKAAISKYHRALIYLKGIEAGLNRMSSFVVPSTQRVLPAHVQDEVNILLVDSHNNLAACLLQSENPPYQRVLDCCNKVLELSSDNVKALYRKGVALFHLGKYDDSIRVLENANKLPAGNTDSNIRRYIAMCRKKLSEQEKQLRDSYQGMFDSSKRKKNVSSDDSSIH